MDTTTVRTKIAKGVVAGLAAGIIATGVKTVWEATVGYGLVSGVALYSITHATVLPALDTEPWCFNNRPGFAWAEFTGHLAFGVTAETTRRFMSKRLASSFRET